MEAILAIDIGTTTICGVAISASGELLASVERPNDAAVAGLGPGRAEQAPQRIRERAFEVIRELTSRVDSVRAVGLTGQMHGMLCVAADGSPRSNLITWQDARCLELDALGVSAIQEIRRRVPESEWDVCGCLPASGFMGSTLFWMLRRGGLPAGTQRVTFVHDWIGSLLTGREPVTDPADAGSAGLFDLEHLR